MKIKRTAPQGAFLLDEAMKYKIKNEQLAKLVYSVFDEEDVQRQITKQIKEGWEKVRFSSYKLNDSFTTKLNPDSEYLNDEKNFVFFVINKNNIEKIREYVSDDWNPYPEVKPPEAGLYLVQQVFSRGEKNFALFRWNNKENAEEDNNYWKFYKVVAFRELPSPYKTPEPKKDETW